VTVAGTTFDGPAVVSFVAAELFDTQPIPDVAIGWPNLAAVLQTLWAHSGGSVRPGPAGPSTAATPYTGREAQLGVVCSDSPYPRDPDRYPAQAAFAMARSGVVGPAWAWGSEGCSQWPVLAPQRYTGPWNHPTAPILVVGTTVDPVTPYRDAIAMSRDLAHARLLTVRGYGDATLFNHSRCADTIEGAYFVTGALPRPGTVCQQDQTPFAG
jgi:pimeloyl-ACP methyl ester carboxylesterase